MADDSLDAGTDGYEVPPPGLWRAPCFTGLQPLPGPPIRAITLSHESITAPATDIQVRRGAETAVAGRSPSSTVIYANVSMVHGANDNDTHCPPGSWGKEQDGRSQWLWLPTAA